MHAHRGYDNNTCICTLLPLAMALYFLGSTPTIPRYLSHNVVYNVVCIYNNRSETDAEDSDESDSDMTTAEC